MKDLLTNPYSFDAYKVERDRHGRAFVKAKIMTTGRLKYQGKDGKIFHGNITLDGLNKATSTAKLKPITIKHPPNLLTPEDVSQYQEGISADDFKVENIDGKDWLVGSLVLQSERAIKTAEDGQLGVSAGYFRFDDDEAKIDENGDLDFSPDINHIAIGCDNPRAEGASISLDEAEDDSARIYSFATTAKPQKHEVKKMKQKLNAVKVGDFSLDEAPIEYDETESKNAINVLTDREDKIVKHLTLVQESMDNSEETHKQELADLSGENKGLKSKVEELETEKETMISMDDLDSKVKELADIKELAIFHKIEGSFATPFDGQKLIVEKVYPDESFDDAEIPGAFKTIKNNKKDTAELLKSKEALKNKDEGSMDEKDKDKVSLSEVSVDALIKNKKSHKK